ncbi:MAG TPA: caspase family protein, partial [Rhodoplanes sp.]|nr:caspase family protein [Rhodoplanes sp.]
MLALAIVSASMLSAEVMRKAVGQQIAPGTQTRAAADPGVPDETRVAALAETGRAATAPQDPQPARTASDPSRDGGPLVALVIGNAAYPDEEAPLVRPLNDARAMAAELRARGFDVELGENLT